MLIFGIFILYISQHYVFDFRMLIDVIDKTRIVNKAKLWQKISNYIYLTLF